MAPFFSAARYMLGPLFSTKKYMNHPIFLDSYLKGHIFLTSCYMHIFFAQRFFQAACSLSIQWNDFNICLTTSNKWVQKIKGQINISYDQVYEWVRFSRARYMDGVGFDILARTPVPELPSLPAPPPPPAPLPDPECISTVVWSFLQCQVNTQLEWTAMFAYTFPIPDSLISYALC